MDIQSKELVRSRVLDKEWREERGREEGARALDAVVDSGCEITYELTHQAL